MKTSTTEIAGLSSSEETMKAVGRSISPAHIMTVLFIEIVNEVEVEKNENREEHQNRLLDVEVDHWKRDEMLKQDEGDMHDLIRGYVRGLRLDLKMDLAKADKSACSMQKVACN
jgi:hypothetical protein